MPRLRRQPPLVVVVALAAVGCSSSPDSLFDTTSSASSTTTSSTSSSTNASSTSSTGGGASSSSAGGSGGASSSAGGASSSAGGMGGTSSSAGGASSSAGGASSSAGGASSSAGGMGGASSSSTSGMGGAGGATFCVPGEKHPCYDGPLATRGVGVCKDGVSTCLPDGSAFGACVGEVLPSPEDCSNQTDDDCDGTVNQASAGCVCMPGAQATCYDGPPGTLGVGVCVAGVMTCAADGKSFGACIGEVLPSPETCLTPGDDNCNGQTNEGGVGCNCAPGSTQPCYSGPPATLNVGVCKAGTQTCNNAGTGFGSCVGEVLPSPETCLTPVDDDCNGQVNEGGAGCVCPPNQKVACYDGPQGTLNVGACVGGLAQCDAQGLTLGACVGEVLPQPETCLTPVDDNCNGQTNEGGVGCVCAPGSTSACYSGPMGTLNVGVCKAGTQTCNMLGTGYGSCNGEVLPSTEVCGNNVDDDCNGQTDESCVTYSGSVKAILAAHCAPCHTTLDSGGANLASVYADTQLASYYCAGKTKGACSLVRIQDGTMPQGAGCTGNPVTDAGNAACLNASEQATISTWILQGQRP